MTCQWTNIHFDQYLVIAQFSFEQQQKKPSNCINSFVAEIDPVLYWEEKRKWQQLKILFLLSITLHVVVGPQNDGLY